MNRIHLRLMVSVLLAASPGSILFAQEAKPQGAQEDEPVDTGIAEDVVVEEITVTVQKRAQKEAGLARAVGPGPARSRR